MDSSRTELPWIPVEASGVSGSQTFFWLDQIFCRATYFPEDKFFLLLAEVRCDFDWMHPVAEHLAIRVEQKEHYLCLTMDSPQFNENRLKGMLVVLKAILDKSSKSE